MRSGSLRSYRLCQISRALHVSSISRTQISPNRNTNTIFRIIWCFECQHMHMAEKMAKQLCIRDYLKTKVDPTVVVRHILSELINNISTDLARPKPKVHTSGLNLQEHTEKKWTTSYPWLVIKEVDKIKRLFCTTCKAATKENVMATVGSMNTQISTIKKHNEMPGNIFYAYRRRYPRLPADTLTFKHDLAFFL